MEKSLKLKRRSQLTMVAIVLAALIGVLAINTDRATAVKADATVETTAVQAETNATTNTGSPTSFYSSAAPSLIKLVSALVIVVVCIYVGVYLLRKLMGKKYSGNDRRIN